MRDPRGDPHTANGGDQRPADSLGALGEDAVVGDILRALGATAAPPWVAVGPGDDAAVLDLPGRLVVCTDTVAEGPDFRTGWSGGHDVGVKVAAQNFADVAAMGAVPRALLVSLSAPASLSGGWPADLRAGLVAECDRAGAVLVGGDVSAAGQIVVTGTALGVLPDGAAPVLRSGARPGDVVALAGATGASAAGLAILLAGSDPEPGWERVLALHRRPQPPYPAGPAAARAGATAMIDVSDGLLRDAERIAAASAVRVDLDPAALAPEPDVADVAARLGADPMAWVLAGGEDHALLATFPPGTAPPEPFRPVGRVLPAAGEAPADPAVLVGGAPWPGSPGWRHFEG